MSVTDSSLPSSNSPLSSGGTNSPVGSEAAAAAGSSSNASPGAASGPAQTSPTTAKGKPQANAPLRRDSSRDVIEAVVTAFILAFLFRCFEAEAFVIPTGSMAPTLYGAHKDLNCTQCGFHFALGASDDLVGSSRRQIFPILKMSKPVLTPGNRSHHAICPNCRYPLKVLNEEIYNGDRILVNKFPYEIGPPERWDVIVFKYPEQAHQNYIKRLVGLPGEEVKIEWGDISVRTDATQPYRLPRKTIDKQRALLQTVYDDQHAPTALLKVGWPERWQPVVGARWTHDPQARSFRLDRDPASGDAWHTLHYRHLVPRSADWQRALEPDQPIQAAPEPELITDTYGYNLRVENNARRFGQEDNDYPEPVHVGSGGSTVGLLWVGDLSIAWNLQVFESTGLMQVQLSEGRRRYRATIDLATGKGRLSYLDDLTAPAQEEIPLGDEFDAGLKSAGEYRCEFLNIDDRVALLVNGRVVKSVDFEPGSRFPPHWEAGPVVPTNHDLTPVSFSCKQASLRISGLSLNRDVYYRTQEGGGPDEYSTPSDLEGLRRLLSNPEAYTDQYLKNRQPGLYPLKDEEDDMNDEFFVLGDNSPRSSDARAWRRAQAVPRRLLIGKAFCIYWPHGQPFLNGGKGYPLIYNDELGANGVIETTNQPYLSLPFYPQVGRMKWIR